MEEVSEVRASYHLMSKLIINCSKKTRIFFYIDIHIIYLYDILLRSKKYILTSFKLILAAKENLILSSLRLRKPPCLSEDAYGPLILK